MKLRIATIDDYNELVSMYKDLLKVVYHGFKLGNDMFIHANVHSWFAKNADIIVCEKDDGTITGFTVAYVESLGIIEPYYYGDIAFVKEEFRKGRSAYLLYNNIIEYAKKINLPVIAKAYVGNGSKDQVDKIQSRWGTPAFTEYTTKGLENGRK